MFELFTFNNFNYIAYNLLNTHSKFIAIYDKRSMNQDPNLTGTNVENR